MGASIETKVIFGLSPPADGKSTVLLGIPRDAWRHMREGKTHHCDLTSAGLPVQLILFGGRDYDDCMKTMEKAIAVAGRAYEDRRRDDFSIQDPVTRALLMKTKSGKPSNPG